MRVKGIMTGGSEHPGGKPRFLPAVSSLKRGGLAAAGFMALVAVFFIVQSLSLAPGSLKLPGPGFFPLALGGALLVLSLAAAFGEWSGENGAARVEFGHRDVTVTAALLFLVPVCFERAGAYLTLGTFGFLMLTLIARTRILTALGSSAAAMAASWYFFHKLLGVQLPAGLLAW